MTHTTSYVTHATSHVTRTTSDVTHATFHVTHATSHVPHANLPKRLFQNIVLFLIFVKNTEIGNSYKFFNSFSFFIRNFFVVFNSKTFFKHFITHIIVKQLKTTELISKLIFQNKKSSQILICTWRKVKEKIPFFRNPNKYTFTKKISKYLNVLNYYSVAFKYPNIP